MATKYKIWIEVERIENYGDEDNESYHDEECPIAIAYRNTLEDAVQLQNIIERVFGELKGPY